VNEPTLTSRALDFVRYNWGNLASLVALIISCIAWLVGKRATRLVEEAREETRSTLLSSSLEEEINLARH
jgi:hypothetical protein